MTLPTTQHGLRTIEVLVVDDNPRSADLVVEILMSFGVSRTVRCHSAGEARLTLAQRRFDAILLECDMPGEDGFSLTRHIRAMAGGPNLAVPIVMLSAATPLSRVMMARDVGADFTIAKPVSPNVLLDRLLWIARRERQFLDLETYRGPDRRVRRAGLPPGVEERRAVDLRLTATPERALSQDEIDGLFP